MRYRLKQYLAALLTVMLAAQAPLVLALSCAMPAMAAENLVCADAGEETCPVMVGGMNIHSGNIDINSDINSDSKINSGLSVHNDDLKLCQLDCCCVILPAPAIADESIGNPVFQIESLLQDFTDRLISTYLESNIRPPIS